MQISQKLFLAFVGLTSIVLIATLSLARWSFDQGFLDYINSLEQERLASLSEDLLTLYAASSPQPIEEGESLITWHAVSQNTLNQAILAHSPQPRIPRDTNAEGVNMPPRSANRAPERLPEQARQGPRSPPPHLRPPVANKHRGGPPTGLYSAEEQYIAGTVIDKKANSISYPLVYNQQVVGYILSNPIREIESSSATAFAKQQRWTSLAIGLVCLLLASALAWWLARFLLVPVNQVMLGVSYLSKGDYDQRLADNKRADELGMLMTNIDHLAMTLAKNRSAKNRWLADISHELRTPLSILCGEIDSIKAGIRPFDHVQLTSIEQEVLRMKHLVDDLYELSLSDVGGLRYHLKSVNISESLETTLTSITATIQDKGLTLTKQITPMLFVSADVRRLEQLFINLLMNAMAYTDSPGEINVQLIHKANMIYLIINDTKPSASEAECECLFEPLYRQDSARTRRGSGAGLGLTICKNIVEAHNGSISAAPSNMGGLCIKVQLPLLRNSL
ncbi:ATP-binding protein [Shewanella inventionis]|uniref:histidine kinase n=1 Tax=Shewanella inventionis TaxID=1738770 RepID=A0ABQ1JP57_9GAMM|nr:ATP-binding protein [Shewanella inventionis]MCL1159424.1 ATP-binding protein [Shewanella inventionis]GGB73287.1 two-component sensor histidine kinase [Shewanella inventionis]